MSNDKSCDGCEWLKFVAPNSIGKCTQPLEDTCPRVKGPSGLLAERDALRAAEAEAEARAKALEEAARVRRAVASVGVYVSETPNANGELDVSVQPIPQMTFAEFWEAFIIEVDARSFTEAERAKPGHQVVNLIGSIEWHRAAAEVAWARAPKGG